MSLQNIYAESIANHQRNVLDYEFIKAHGAAYYAGHYWKSKHGGHTEVSTGPHASLKEADEALIEMLKSARYEAPKWWQYWRWGERVPKCWIDAKSS